MDIQPGSLTENQFDLYVELTRISSDTIKQALKKSLVLGLTDDQVIETVEGVNSSNYHRGKRAFKRVYEIVEKIKHEQG